MREFLTQRGHPTAARTTRGSAGLHEDGSSAWERSWLAAVFFWLQRSTQRQALRELARFDDRLLKDIGVSLAQVQREVAKPFWRQ